MPTQTQFNQLLALLNITEEVSYQEAIEEGGDAMQGYLAAHLTDDESILEDINLLLPLCDRVIAACEQLGIDPWFY